MVDVKIEQRTINKIHKILESGKSGTVTIKGVKVVIDPSQPQYKDEKTGGFLPLLALIPLIAKVVAAAGVATGGIATAAKVGYDMAKGGCIDSEPNTISQDDKPPCMASVIDAILTLHKAGFTIMRL